MADMHPAKPKRKTARVRMRFRAITVTFEGNAVDASSVIAQAIIGSLRTPEPGDDDSPLPELDSEETE
jgi:hypothetical protein